MNTERQLTALLEDSGVAWQRKMGEIRFRLTSGGMIWEMACRCLDSQVLLYGRYPFRIPPDRRAQALEACCGVNRQVIRGGMYLTEEGRAVFRTWAGMSDGYTARENLAQALEYNIAVVTRFWGRMASDICMSEESIPGSSKIDLESKG